MNSAKKQYVTNRKLTVIPHHGDIIKVVADAIVTSESRTKIASMVTKALVAQVGGNRFNSLRKQCIGRSQIEDLFVTNMKDVVEFPFDYVIHMNLDNAVHQKTIDRTHLELVYMRAIYKADELKIKRVAVPLLAAGSGGGDAKLSAELAISALSCLDLTTVTTVIIATIDAKLETYLQELCQRQYSNHGSASANKESRTSSSTVTSKASSPNSDNYVTNKDGSITEITNKLGRIAYAPDDIETDEEDLGGSTPCASSGHKERVTASISSCEELYKMESFGRRRNNGDNPNENGTEKKNDRFSTSRHVGNKTLARENCFTVASSAGNRKGKQDVEELMDAEAALGESNMKQGTQDTEELTGAEASLGTNSTKQGKEEEQHCPICMDDIVDEKILDKCGHKFCKDCIEQSFKNYKRVCPSCQMFYGTNVGNMPHGTMDFNVSSFPSLPGYERDGTIQVNYHFDNGTQSDKHPHPGRSYRGTSRTAYLPDNSAGRTVLRLLQLAFQRKLTFTVGRSVTTGCDDVVVWNDIHHKTNRTGGTTNYGYPDKTYLTRVTSELVSKGVTVDELTMKSRD